ncbi:hypothetical protein CCB80_14785 [Armatimonadetes bacterium Uphvl-Ar1]|nr:hypothetical protein CCB80_14785 [Armatimonadetes bacterium Uphvl-Ar1]
MPWFNFICEAEELLSILKEQEVRSRLVGFKFMGRNKTSTQLEILADTLLKGEVSTIYFGLEPDRGDREFRMLKGRYAGICHMLIPEMVNGKVLPGSISYDDKALEYDFPPAEEVYKLLRKKLKKICPLTVSGKQVESGGFPRVSERIWNLISDAGGIDGLAGSRYYAE